LEAKVKEVVSTLLQHMKISGEIKVHTEDDIIFAEVKSDDMSLLIGKKGRNLNALQYITNIIINKGSEVKRRVFIDTEGYREKRVSNLRALAVETADRVKQAGKSFSLNPMSPSDRKIIHAALKEDGQIMTASEGEGRERRVVISLKTA